MLLAALSQTEVDACGGSASSACLFVWRQTHNEILARAADWLIAKPLKIVLIVLLAVAAVRVLRKSAFTGAPSAG